MMRSVRSLVLPGQRLLLLRLARQWPERDDGGLRCRFLSTPPPPAGATPTTFAALGIHHALIERLPPGVRAPTADQAEAARALLGSNHDGGSGDDGGDGGGGDGGRRVGVVALAGPTGTGKTLAYLLPLLTRWMSERAGRGGNAVLVVSPSQELAAQVARVGKGLLARPAAAVATRDAAYAAAAPARTAALGSVQLLIGGASIARQRAALAELGADRRTGPLAAAGEEEEETEAARAARLRRAQAGRRVARERRRTKSPPAAPLALVAGTPARLARLLSDGSLDGRAFGALVLEEADQLSAGSGGGVGVAGQGDEDEDEDEDGSSGDDDDGDDQHHYSWRRRRRDQGKPFFPKKGYADALAAVCASLPEEARARAVLVSATLRRRPGALAALMPLLLQPPQSLVAGLDTAAAAAAPVFVPASSPAAAVVVPPLKGAAAQPQPQPHPQPQKPRHVLVLAPPQHRAAAARAALRALGARAALVFAAERGGRLEDAAAKLRGLVAGEEGGGVWVLHGGMAPAGRKAALCAFVRAAAGAEVEQRRPKKMKKEQGEQEDGEDDDDYSDSRRAPLPLFPAAVAAEEQGGRGGPAPSPSAAAARPPLAVLVASDLAARGLDLPGLDAVVSLDPPRTAEAYAHRAGRVGRLGGGGSGGASAATATAMTTKTGPAFVVTVATAGGQAAAVRRLCASLGIALVEAPG